MVDKMNFTFNEFRKLPRRELERLGILPLVPLGSGGSPRIVVLCAWPQDDEYARRESDIFLRHHIPGVHFEFVQIVEENPSTRLLDMISRSYDEALSEAQRVPFECAECLRSGVSGVASERIAICDNCLKTRLTCLSERGNCLMCEHPQAPYRVGQRVTICTGCMQFALEIIASRTG